MPVRGRLSDPATAPRQGEVFQELVRIEGPRQSVVIEQILSAASAEPTAYLQSHDEWVVVLAGGATLDVDGDHIRLDAGDWVLLPAGVRHTVVSTEPATSWLAVHVGAQE